jgi:hypothetical protein
MGVYAAAGALLVGLLALVLWIGGPAPLRSHVALPEDSRWAAAAIDDGRSPRTLRRGESIEAPPGRYRLTLFDGEGRSELRELTVSGELTTIED